MPGFARLDRRRAAAEVLLIALGWLSMGAALGAGTSLVAIAAPMAVGNAVLMAYIATNHLLRPLARSGDPLETSLSVRTPAPLDRLHFRFSHHVEHHLFPAMSGRYLPLVRSWLERNAGDRFVCAPHGRALVWLYRTPRTYGDRATLVDLERRERAPVDLEALARDLRGDAARTA
jgi:fatty acid desaturase